MLCLAARPIGEPAHDLRLRSPLPIRRSRRLSRRGASSAAEALVREPNALPVAAVEKVAGIDQLTARHHLGHFVGAERPEVLPIGEHSEHIGTRRVRVRIGAYLDIRGHTVLRSGHRKVERLDLAAGCGERSSTQHCPSR
jgi:hypothetical protein